MNPGLFIGSYTAKLDSKSRLCLPAPFRLTLGGSAIYGFASPSHPAIEGVTLAFLTRIAQAIESRNPLFSDQEDRLSAQLLAEAYTIPLDDTGRFTVPEPLRIHGDLQESCLFVGRGNRFQIWHKSRFEAHKAQFKGQPLALNIGALDIGGA